MDSTTVLWYSTLAVIVGAIVRVVKDDSVPLTLKGVTVPKGWRPILAVALGAIGGALDIAARGTPWKSALLMGLASAIAAMSGHAALIDGMRDGRELGDDRKDGES